MHKQRSKKTMQHTTDSKPNPPDHLGSGGSQKIQNFVEKNLHSSFIKKSKFRGLPEPLLGGGSSGALLGPPKAPRAKRGINQKHAAKHKISMLFIQKPKQFHHLSQSRRGTPQCRSTRCTLDVWKSPGKHMTKARKAQRTRGS